MPIFGFKKDKKNKKVPKKASSMSNIYNDYGGTAKLQEVEEFEENQEICREQYRGLYDIICIYLMINKYLRLKHKIKLTSLDNLVSGFT